jgi:8-oxo-dGTP pyrophosphatase MutT (NUDIX family)
MEKKIDKNLMHYVVVTGILVNSERKFLIVKRADWEKAFPSRWTVPGGKLEVFDYVLRERDTSSHWYNVLEDLLKREIKEEVGLEFDNLGYVTSLVYIRPDKIPCLIVSLSASVKNEGKEVKLCNALTEYAWVNLEEAKNYGLIEGIYEELEILDKRMKGKEKMAWRETLKTD